MQRLEDSNNRKQFFFVVVGCDVLDVLLLDVNAVPSKLPCPFLLDVIVWDGHLFCAQQYYENDLNRQNYKTKKKRNILFA